MITGSQIRMARGYLKWSVEQLAKNAEIGVSTIRRMEDVDGVPSASGKNLEAVQTALEAAGVVFVDPNGLGPGVRLREKG
jgi:ribosome-binding protein aMBF1 (putative translation factor)